MEAQELSSGYGKDRLGDAPRSALTRRAFIRVAAGGAVVGAAGLSLLLDACGGAAPSSAPGSTAAGGAPATQAGKAAAFPTYIPFTGGPKPDYHSSDPRITDGFENYPKSPFKAWTKDPPGTGKNVSVFIAAHYPPPTPFANNPTWHEVNKRLNANVQMNIVAPADYRVKLATLMAGNDLPDIIHLFFGIQAAPALPDFIKAQCADLTPYLSGDAIKEYPFLASIPTYAWKNSLSRIDGRIYQWPIHRYLPGLSYFFKNSDTYDKVIGADHQPKDVDDLKRILKELNQPSKGQWAWGGIARYPFNFGVVGVSAIFGAPFRWALDNSGKLTAERETEAFKSAVSFVADLWKAGMVWPDAVSANNQRTNFVAGKFAMCIEGFGNSWNDFWRQGLEQAPPRHFDIIKPFRAHAGDKPISFITGGYVSTNVMKKASPDRIKEQLRIVDYLASPFGSQEDLLLSYGLSGTDYHLDSRANPKPTKAGNTDAGYVPWRYMSQHPYVEYQADLTGYAKRLFEVEKLLVDEGVSDATDGFYSRTRYDAKGSAAEQSFWDGVNSVILGRKPFSSYDQLVKDWKTAAGDQIRKEYLEAMAAAK